MSLPNRGLAGAAGARAGGHSSSHHHRRHGSSTAGAASSAPQTPPTSRALPSLIYGSPSTARAEDELIVIELGCRGIRVGFAGDAFPRAVLRPSPATGRRVGDFRPWAVGWTDQWRGRDWQHDHELWPGSGDVRDVDLGLLADRLERLLKDAFIKYLLIDSTRARRICLVLPSTLPLPILSVVLDTLFAKFQPPMVPLLSSATAAAVGAGIRSALVVDLGWTETVVTSVYEYREVRVTRTVRAGRLLVDATHDVLRRALEASGDTFPPEEECEEVEGQGQGQGQGGGGAGRRRQRQWQKRPRVVSFEECEEICRRLMWCRPMAGKSRGGKGAGGGDASTAAAEQTTALPTVREQDESEQPPPPPPQPHPRAIRIPLQSIDRPRTVSVSFDDLAAACEDTFISGRHPGASEFDDHEQPVPLLVVEHLLRLSVDVRAICMSRIAFTGGCSAVLGLRERIMDEVAALGDRREWSTVTGGAVARYRDNPKLGGGRLRQQQQEQEQQRPEDDGPAPGPVPVVDDPRPPPLEPDPDPDPAFRDRQQQQPAPAQGRLRTLDTAGSWAGASLVCHLRIAAIATVERDGWLLHGAAGASRSSDVDLRALQRHSLGGGGYPFRGSGAGGSHSWTLGTWGALG